MIGFLQGFNEDEILLTVRDDFVARIVVEKAIEIAMLGLPERFEAICKILVTSNQLQSSNESVEFESILRYSDVDPFDVDKTSHDAVGIVSDEGLRKKGLAARKYFMHLPEWLDWDDPGTIDQTTIDRMESLIENGAHDCSTTGYVSMKESAEYAALISIAYDLDMLSIVDKYMPTILKRIHANQQARYLSMIPNVWRDYLLPGYLREELGVTKPAVDEYSQHICSVIEKRFRDGPLRPEQLFPNCSMSQLLKLIDQNTRSDEFYEKYVSGASVDKTVLCAPATDAQIASTETRLGRTLPEDIKEFYRYANGCTPIKVFEHSFLSSLPPLDELFVEQEDYMNDYGFTLLPLLPLSIYNKIKWPGLPNGGIAFYESDGQGTQYLWILGAEDIKTAKQSLLAFYDKASNDEKAVIDRYIIFWFGSREQFDTCQDHCYYEVHWGDAAQGIYPNFHSYLASLATQSQHIVERSPVELPRELRIV